MNKNIRTFLFAFLCDYVKAFLTILYSLCYALYIVTCKLKLFFYIFCSKRHSPTLHTFAEAKHKNQLLLTMAPTRLWTFGHFIRISSLCVTFLLYASYYNFGPTFRIIPCKVRPFNDVDLTNINFSTNNQFATDCLANFSNNWHL